MKKIAVLFPGQGAQFPGMGKDFYEAFSASRETFEEAEDILQRDIHRTLFSASSDELNDTVVSQIGIFVMSVALDRVLQTVYSEYQPKFFAGFSLGEYVALVRSGMLEFSQGLTLLDARAHLMQKACLEHLGGMVAILGLNYDEVSHLISSLPKEAKLWVANDNCPGQVVVSGSLKGLDLAKEEALKAGAHKVLRLQVQGAFHSGLMQSAKDHLDVLIDKAPFKKGQGLVMNASGTFQLEIEAVKRELKKQIVSPVLWRSSILTIEKEGVEGYLEVGPGHILRGFNRRIGCQASTFCVGQVSDIQKLESFFLT